jgi:hypothetical protein
MINKPLLKDSLGWGFALWLFGYVLGFILAFTIPPSLIGWVILPIGLVVALWVLFKKVKIEAFKHYVILAAVWPVIAIVFDYFFIVKAIKPADGYYKLDVYVYYLLTFSLPLIAYFWKKSKRK